MQIPVEFYGIARSRAGVSAASACGTCVGEILEDLASRFPALAESCIDGRHIRPGCIVNLNGDRFVSDPDTPLTRNDVVLLMSADAGG